VEDRAAPHLAFDLDAPAVSVDGGARDREAEPDAALASRTSGIDTVEPLEDPLLVDGGDARAVVLGLEDRIAGRPARDPDVDVALLRRT
jgi:hypothetical protein